jgi:hypothetical protein
MQTIKRKKGAFDDLKFEIDLTTYGKTLSDIADIVFLIKVNEDDASSLFEKKKSLTQITATGTTIVTALVQWATTEYSQFEIGETYLAGLFVKFTGDPAYDEHTDDLFHLIIEQDFVNE